MHGVGLACRDAWPAAASFAATLRTTAMPGVRQSPAHTIPSPLFSLQPPRFPYPYRRL
jgi:hypothetical protein